MHNYYVSAHQSKEEQNLEYKDGWKCYCGKNNSNYSNACRCGLNRKEAEEKIRQRTKQSEHIVQKHKAERLHTEEEILKLIAQYKLLFDQGALSEAEFQAKKDQLLKQDQ